MGKLQVDYCKQFFSPLVLRLQLASWLPGEGLLEQVARLCPPLPVPDSGGLGWGPKACIPHQLPGHADAAGLGATM